MVHSSLIQSLLKPKASKQFFTAFLLDVLHENKQHGTSLVSHGLVGKSQDKMTQKWYGHFAFLGN